MELKDALGIAPIAESIKKVVDGTVDGTAAFLGRICLPAAEEYGLFLRDKIHSWRSPHVLNVVSKAEHKLSDDRTARLHAHPRLVGTILEQSSWSDADDVQDMWAGLLASSCTTDGKDDSNLMFIDLLGRLTVSQVRIFNHSCNATNLILTTAGWFDTGLLIVDLEFLQQLTGLTDVQRIDRELDHLRSLGLMGASSGFFDPALKQAQIGATSLALQMYARCQGFRDDPVEFYKRLGRIA